MQTDYSVTKLVGMTLPACLQGTTSGAGTLSKEFTKAWVFNGRRQTMIDRSFVWHLAFGVSRRSCADHALVQRSGYGVLCTCASRAEGCACERGSGYRGRAELARKPRDVNLHDYQSYLRRRPSWDGDS